MYLGQIFHTLGGGYETRESSQSAGDAGYGEAHGAERDEQLQNQKKDDDLDGLKEDLDLIQMKKLKRRTVRCYSWIMKIRTFRPS